MTDKFTEDHKLETYKSMISISVEGFKMLALLNGGAAAGILAAFDKVKGAIHPMYLKYGVICFVIGLVCVGLSFFGSYFTQFSLFDELMTAKKNGAHVKPLRFAMATCAASLVFFAIGAVVVACGIDISQDMHPIIGR